MPADNPDQPADGGEKQRKERMARAERLSAALRENLKRRKNQARVRRQGAGGKAGQPAGEQANETGAGSDPAARESDG